MQIRREERDVTVKTMIAARRTIHAWRGMATVTTITIAPVLWFVPATAALDMDSMLMMIAVQVNLFENCSWED